MQGRINSNRVSLAIGPSGIDNVQDGQPLIPNNPYWTTAYGGVTLDSCRISRREDSCKAKRCYLFSPTPAFPWTCAGGGAGTRGGVAVNQGVANGFCRNPFSRFLSDALLVDQQADEASPRLVAGRCAIASGGVNGAGRLAARAPPGDAIH